jgi:hypothetical protein
MKFQIFSIPLAAEPFSMVILKLKLFLVKIMRQCLAKKIKENQNYQLGLVN